MKFENLTLDEALKKYKPEHKGHFINGWKMYPEFWSHSTESWKIGFLARAIYIDKKSN